MIYLQPSSARTIQPFRRYKESTSQWTLDYPPFFAFFELGLAQLAYYVESSVICLQAAPVDSEVAKVFLRATVIGADCVFLVAAALLTR